MRNRIFQAMSVFAGRYHFLKIAKKPFLKNGF